MASWAVRRALRRSIKAVARGVGAASQPHTRGERLRLVGARGLGERTRRVHDGGRASRREERARACAATVLQAARRGQASRRAARAADAGVLRAGADHLDFGSGAAGLLEEALPTLLAQLLPKKLST